MSIMNFYILLLVIYLISICSARRHHLEVREDFRRYIPLSSFGFYIDGLLTVKLVDFRVKSGFENDVYGFSLDKTLSDSMNPYLDSHQTKCILNDKSEDAHGSGLIAYFIMNLKDNKVHLRCSEDWENFNIYKNESMISTRLKRQSYYGGNIVPRNKRQAPPGFHGDCSKIEIPMTVTEKDEFKYYSFSFVLYIGSKADEGLYNLYFHSCPNYKAGTTKLLNFNVDIEEHNRGNFLSAGEMPLPALYFMMSILFFLSGLFWLFILKKSKHPVFKIHYLMAVLVFLKSLSLMFHAINYHYIEIKGEHVEAWAILFYITHLLKGAVLFITIVLIGTGWTFIKHILADKDKKLFMIVIPLQILANVAEIIIAESEAGDIEHRTWHDIFILVDLLCCGAILFPVVWSIRHLQEASATDGKAAINLKKLKLFRQFYIMIVCYIYFTRIIVYLLRITVAFQYAWLDEMFREMATYVFFVLTGYKFRPVLQNPYFIVNAEDDDDDDEVEILTQSGLTESVNKLTNRSMPPSTIIESNEDERENLISKRESSHEYD